MHSFNTPTYQMGDVVYVTLYGMFRHYGIVIQEATPFQEAVIRTVLRTARAPVNQPLSLFSQGAPVFIAPYQSQLSRWAVVQKALNILEFEYDLAINNCEHFYRRAHGHSNLSVQVHIAAAVLALGMALIFKKHLAIA